ncbi:MAG: ABC transporter permease [Saccharofermentanales bacterium]
MVKKKEKNALTQKILARPDSSAVFALLLLIIVFTSTTDSFLSRTNIFNVTRNAALYMFASLGQAIVLVTGGMNVSVGAVGGLVTVATGICLQELGLPIPVTIGIALCVGILCGLINGIIITRLKINAFVTTLATSYVYTGLVFGLSKGYAYTGIPPSFSWIGRTAFLGLPILFYLIVLMMILIWFFFRYTMTGRMILATGGNKEAAQLSGIKTNSILVLVNVMSGLFSAVAALLWVSRMGSAPPATGQDWVMISYAVSIIGGTALAGGRFSPFGFFCSGLMIAIIKNGLIMLEVNIYYETDFPWNYHIGCCSVRERTGQLYKPRT